MVSQVLLTFNLAAHDLLRDLQLPDDTSTQDPLHVQVKFAFKCVARCEE